ncbi:MAG: chemotaxis protein CheW [Deferrisomatales bacterium]
MPGNGLERWRRALLEALREDVGRGPEPGERPAPPPALREVLTFDLSGETYGLDLGDVGEILLPRPLTPLPRTPGFVLGVASLRGTVLPVLDLAQRLGLPPSGEPTRRSRILVVRDGEERLGFRVDRVRGVARFSDGELEACGVAASVDPHFLKGIGYDGTGTLVALLDAESLCEFELEAA